METVLRHPEVCFAKLAGEALAKKDSEDGKKERRDVLADDPELSEEISKYLDRPEADIAWHHRISKGRLDDVLDAAVLAHTAKQLNLGSGDRGNEHPAFQCGNDQHDEVLDITPEIVHPGPD